MSLPSEKVKRFLGSKFRVERLEERLTLALMLDIGFDGNGSLTTDFGFGFDSAQAVGFQSGDRIIAGGYAWNGVNEDFALARYLSDGSLDRSFGINGGIRTDFFGDHERLFGIEVQPDNKIIAVGTSFFTDNFGNRDTNFAIARYLPDGEPDPTFGNLFNIPNAQPGQTLVDFFGGTPDTAYDVAVLQSGHILVAGHSFSPLTFSHDFSLVRLNPNGTVDTSFGFNGLVAVDTFGGDDFAFDMAVQPDGRIILVGYGQNGFQGEDIITMRFSTTGQLEGISAPIHFGPQDRAFAVDLQPDGRIVVAGSVYVNEQRGADFAVMRLDPNGILDTSFGNNGAVLTDFGQGADAAFAVDVLPNGGILATGEAFLFTDYDLALAAYNSNGSPDVSRLTGDANTPPGTITKDFQLGNDAGVSTIVQNDGSILVVGRAFIGGDDDFAIVRYSEARSGPTGNIDTDGDSLLDDWEINGIDINNDGVVDLDLRALGADPMRRDLFVEVDAMIGRAPLPNTVSDVVQAFANAPVLNPDGTMGINLHIIVDELNLPAVDWPAQDQFTGFPLGAFQTYQTNFGTRAERNSNNATNILNAKAMVFRYGIFGKSYGNTTSSGIARGIPGDMFVVTLDGVGATPDTEPGTLMHEFGHTIGLRHGGDDDVNNKPGYLSVMSYTYQFRNNSNRDVWRLDFDREGRVHDDWNKLVYNFRATNSRTAGLSNQTESFEMIEEPANTLNDPVIDVVPGDSNHDGIFDSSDLVLVFAAGEYEDGVTGNSTFEEGDWDGDGDFTTSDLVFAFAAGTYQANAVAIAEVTPDLTFSRFTDDDRTKRRPGCGCSLCAPGGQASYSVCFAAADQPVERSLEVNWLERLSS